MVQPDRDAVLLVHGGLYEPRDAHRFWTLPGVTAALEGAGLLVLAPDRLRAPRSWQDEADALAGHLTQASLGATAVVAGSNGCSAAIRLAIDHPARVSSLVLCWPAPAGDERIDANMRTAIEAAATAEVADRLLAGETVRGVSDAELRTIERPVTIVPSEPENLFHQHGTVKRLLAMIPNATLRPGSPESPRPEFAEARDRFVATLLDALAR